MTERSLEADVLRTSECGFAASKRPPSRSAQHGDPVVETRPALRALVDDDPWFAAVEIFRQRAPRRRDRLAEYEQLLAHGTHRAVAAAVVQGSHVPAPPVEKWINKADGRKKRVFQYPPLDELLFRVVNRLVQPAALALASPWCRSFLPGGGPRAAFRGVLRTPGLDGADSLRLDVRDYFNSIDVHDLMARIPAAFTDGPLGDLLRAALFDDRVERAGTIVRDGRKGIMAGTPLAPVLATLYLRDVDREIAESGAGYSRYSDDVLVLAEPKLLAELERLIRARLAERGLEINEEKSGSRRCGEGWVFLGFRYDGGRIGLAKHTTRKLRAKSTRLARALHRWREQRDVDPARALRAFVRRTNRRLYGVSLERAEFSWATWFLPMLDRSDDLIALDHHLQREARYASTGRRTERTRKIVPHDAIRDAGHLPLVAAYWAMRGGTPAYDALVSRRTGLGSGDVSPA